MPHPALVDVQVLFGVSLLIPSLQQLYYPIRCQTRDGKCLITGLLSQTYSRLNVAHIFPRAHDAEVSNLFLLGPILITEHYGYQWVREGYPSKITDTADMAVMGGQIKIDSVQNLITLRSDLHDAWDNYEFGVDPNVSSILVIRSY